MSVDLLILTSIILPLFGALLISRLDRIPNVREMVTLLVSTALLIVVVGLYGHLEHMSDATLVLAQPFAGMEIAFSLNPLGMLFALIAAILWLVTSIYASGYMRAHHEKHQTRFYALFAIAISAVMAIAFADNLFTLFLFYEILTLSTYPLVTHSGDEKAKRSGRIYLGVLMGTSIGLFLPAMLIIWHFTGNLQFTQGGVLGDHIPSEWIALIYALFIFGIGKAAVMPMHKWLPAAMVAPTPVSALLHAVAVVKAGVFAILKITIFIFGPEALNLSGANHWIIWFPMATILLASFIAMTKDNLKERLAYSTISQLSYIVLGAVLANSLGLLGASLHIAMHAFAKISLFFAAGAILVTAHKTKVSELSGLGRTMPFTFLVFLIGSLSIVGLPPFGGMWSKWYLLLASMDFSGPEGTKWALLVTLLLSSLLNIAYLVVIPVKAFFSPLPAGQSAKINEAPLPCIIGMAIPAVFCVYLFFYPEPFYSLAKAAVFP
ncbi:proton-conducting transporter membrane subunit [Aliiglaciecola sp. LCG003]|uniref:proton-conducting transporter transmembrane domain-containing protein n=1 Tax=Aliiglaciecola sp. LCG003 TaxID=3053655 RepID=UPI0025746275|nr:proton-conducting transporter membrane subunit [Aliiglaciecola sp. LCG003]WJG08219.1 proton-conducting transporter membrane subunit [Aliiglaciecola sp. LCG003]